MTRREVGTCSSCHAPVMSNGEVASCPCGKVTIPLGFLKVAAGGKIRG